jgi:hypothetical protein
MTLKMWTSDSGNERGISSVQEFSKCLERSSGISIDGFKNSVFTDSDA